MILVSRCVRYSHSRYAHGTSASNHTLNRDSVFFYCHRSTLLSKSSNAFGAILSTPTSSSGPNSNASPRGGLSQSQSPSAPQSGTSSSSGASSSLGAQGVSTAHASPPSLPMYALMEPSEVINVVLHIVYDMYVARRDSARAVLTC